MLRATLFVNELERCLFFVVMFIIVSGVMLTTDAAAQSESEAVRFHETFEDLDDWKPLTFRKIDRHSSYKTAEVNGDKVLKTESQNAASALVYKKTFNVRNYPVVRWRWKIQQVYEEGNAKTKAGDDYPIRLYIIFEYNPDEAGLIRKAKYATARKIHGQYPPDSTLNYIWANRDHDEKILTSKYTDRAKLVIRRTGNKHAGEWVKEKVNIVDDYKAAFGEEPPAIATIAVMNDSDNTGESSISWIDDICVYAENYNE